jgi:phage gp29-like protein
MHQKRITRNLGLPDDLGFTSTSVGSHAKAREEMDMFLAYVSRNQQYIKDIVNRQIVPAMILYNFSKLPDNYRLPSLVFESIEEKNLKLTAETFKIMVDAGSLDPNEPFIRDQMNYPPKEVEGELAESQEPE